jgi:Tfp pilus assembly protein PilX
MGTGARGRQDGVIVFVALIAMVVLSLAAVGLMRSVQTNTLVVGNIAFRQAAAHMASSAVEKAIHDMFPPSQTIPSLWNHDTTRNYYASVQPGQDVNGVPRALQGDLSLYPGGAQVIRETTDAQTSYVARYVIERMCNDNRLGLEANAQNCEMIPPKQSIGKESNLKKGIALEKIPFYRMTVRVDGPGNSVAFSQAMLR